MAQQTLADYTTPDTPAGRLRTLIENPDDPAAYDYDLAYDFVHHSNPTGFDDAKQITDPDLLRAYRDLCREHLPGDHFAENPIVRHAADHKTTIIDTLDALIAEAEFPPEHEWPVDPDFVDWVRQLDLPERGDYRFDRQGWERVWDACTPTQLRFIRDACRHARGCTGNTSTPLDDVLTTMLYYHAETDIDELLTVNNRGNGPSPACIKQNVAATLDRLDPVIGALLVDWLCPEIRTNVSEISGSGNYDQQTQSINIASDGDIESRRARGGTRCTTTHELAHALHDMYGFFVDGGDSVDNRGREPSDWSWRVSDRAPDQLTTSQGSFMATVRQEWEKLKRGDLDPIREYQTKNADEFICCGFECWVVNPAQLAATQPRMKQLFDAHFGPQDYNAKQLRLEPMLSPDRCHPCEGTVA